jgi:hypothetical protein
LALESFHGVPIRAPRAAWPRSADTPSQPGRAAATGRAGRSVVRSPPRHGLHEGVPPPGRRTRSRRG